jgi:hypothetical protein
MSFALAVDVKRDPGGDWVLTGALECIYKDGSLPPPPPDFSAPRASVRLLSRDLDGRGPLAVQVAGEKPNTGTRG